MAGSGPEQACRDLPGLTTLRMSCSVCAALDIRSGLDRVHLVGQLLSKHQERRTTMRHAASADLVPLVFVGVPVETLQYDLVPAARRRT